MNHFSSPIILVIMLYLQNTSWFPKIHFDPIPHMSRSSYRSKTKAHGLIWADKRKMTKKPELPVAGIRENLWSSLLHWREYMYCCWGKILMDSASLSCSDASGIKNLLSEKSMNTLKLVQWLSLVGCWKPPFLGTRRHWEIKENISNQFY